MKIFYLGRYNESENLTGPEKVAKRIFNESSKKNTTVFIEYFFDGRKFSFIKKLFGKDTISHDNLNILRLGAVTLFFYMLKEKPDLIHIINYERFAAVAFFYKLLSRTKIIYTVHGIICYENYKYKNATTFYKFRDKICEYIFFRYSDKLAFLSEESVNIASQDFKIDRSKVGIFPNGIDEIFHAAGKNKIHNKSDELKILFTGNVDRKEKGFELLNKTLLNIRFPFRLYILSDNKNIENKNYSFVSKMDTKNYADFLIDKDVFVSPSEYEPFSISAVESMAAGLVPVVTNQTGMSRFIKSYSNGIVTGYGNVENLAAILNELNDDRELLLQISKNAKLIYEKLSWEKVYEKYHGLYLRLIKS